MLYKTMMVLATAAAMTMTSCMHNGDGDDNNSPNKPGSSGSGDDPEVVDPNPKELNPLIAPLDNPQYNFDGIYLSSDQRLTSTGDWRFVNLETVSSIDDIKTIPWGTWVESTYIRAGYGLLAYNPKFGFWTIYVDNLGLDESLKAVYAALVYRKSFNGCDQQITLSASELNFDDEGGSESLAVTTKTFTSYSAVADRSWCKVELKSTEGLTFVPNSIVVTVEPNDSDEPRTATVTVSSIWGKNTVVSIAQAGK